jgi:hypothetical protein
MRKPPNQRFCDPFTRNRTMRQVRPVCGGWVGKVRSYFEEPRTTVENRACREKIAHVLSLLRDVLEEHVPTDD